MTRKVLLVGDPHLKIGAIKEAGSFLDKLLDIVRDGHYEKVVILGDLFDTFAVIRSEIMSLWSRFLAQSSEYSHVILIVGNHDMAGESGGAHALEPFKCFNNVTVIDDALLSDGMTYYMPFYRDNQAFVDQCKSIPEGALLFCHQSFNGAQFENGFYDPHGVDPSAVSHLAAVVSGHIHKSQKIGNIWYPGTPYQINFADAGENKGVFEIELTPNGYNTLGQIDLGLPQFFVVEASTIPELLNSVSEITSSELDLSSVNLKLVATGGPAEIVQFWKEDSVKLLKSKAKRVVDALVSMKTEVVLPGASAKNKRERLHDFVNSKKWRIPNDKLIDAAERILTE